MLEHCFEEHWQYNQTFPAASVNFCVLHFRRRRRRRPFHHFLPFGRSYFTRASLWCLPNIWSMFIFHFTVCAVFVNFHIVDRHHLLDKTCVCFISKIMWNSLVAYRWIVHPAQLLFTKFSLQRTRLLFFILLATFESPLSSLYRLSISISLTSIAMLQVSCVFTQLIPYQIKHP